MAAPSKLTPTLLTKLETVADQGLQLKEVCSEIGISDDSWRSWENRPANPDDELHARFLGLAARVRAGMGSATDDLAWGALRRVLESEGEWVEGPDGEREYVRGPSTSDRIAAATAILRLKTAHKVELTGKNGGPVAVDVDGARDLLVAGLERLKPKPDA